MTEVQVCPDCQLETTPNGPPKHAPDCPRFDKQLVIDFALRRGKWAVERDGI